MEAAATSRLTVASAPETARRELSLEKVYREHVSFVWRNARRLGCDSEWADDAVHEVFLVVAKKLGEYREQDSLRSWLFAITYRVVQRLRRSRFRYQLRLVRLAAERPHDDRAEPHRKEEAGRELRRILDRLGEAKRVVFILAELEGMTTPEIAQCLGARPGTIDSRLRAARRDIQAILRRERSKEERGR